MAGTAITAGASILGGAMSSSAAHSAASAQESAAHDAAQVQQNMFDTTQKNLAPYMGVGKSAANQLAYLMGITPDGSYYSNMSPSTAAPATSTANTSTSAGGPINIINSGISSTGRTLQQLTPQQRSLIQAIRPDLLSLNSNIGEQDRIGAINTLLSGNSLTSSMTGGSNAGGAAAANPNSISINPNEGGFGSLAQPVVMDQAHLEQTPGYQFNLTQGLKSVQNAASARGLGSSGAALKGAASYATGLADSTYQQQFANEVTNQTNQYNRLSGLMTSGQNAAAGLGTTSAQVGSNIANTSIGAGNAAAAGTIGSAGAISGGINNAANMYYMNQLMQGMYGGSGLTSALNSGTGLSSFASSLL